MGQHTLYTLVHHPLLGYLYKSKKAILLFELEQMKQNAIVISFNYPNFY